MATYEELKAIATSREPVPAEVLNPLVEKYSRMYGVDPSVPYGIFEQESQFDQYAVSPGAGCAGVGQLKASTNAGIAAQLGEEVTEGDRFDLETNIRRSIYHIADITSKHGLEGGLKVYKAGPVGLEKETYDPHVKEYTSDYVNKVMARINKHKGQRGPDVSALSEDRYEELKRIATAGVEPTPEAVPTPEQPAAPAGGLLPPAGDLPAPPAAPAPQQPTRVAAAEGLLPPVGDLPAPPAARPELQPVAEVPAAEPEGVTVPGGLTPVAKLPRDVSKPPETWLLPKEKLAGLPSEKIPAGATGAFPEVEREPLANRVGKAWGRSVASMVRGLGGAAEFTKIPGVSDFGKNVAYEADRMRKFYDVEDPTLLDTVIEGVSSGIQFLVPSVGIARGTALVGLLGQSANAAKIAAWLGIGTNAVVEAAVEAGNTYKNLQEQGKSERDATMRALASLTLNLGVITASNMAGGMFTRKAGKTATNLSRAQRIRQAAGDMIQEMAGEGAQEGAQEVIGAVAEERPLKAKEILTAAGIGALSAGVVSPIVSISAGREAAGEVAPPAAPPAVPPVTERATEVEAVAPTDVPQKPATYLTEEMPAEAQGVPTPAEVGPEAPIPETLPAAAVEQLGIPRSHVERRALIREISEQEQLLADLNKQQADTGTDLSAEIAEAQQRITDATEKLSGISPTDEAPVVEPAPAPAEAVSPAEEESAALEEPHTSQDAIDELNKEIEGWWDSLTPEGLPAEEWQAQPGEEYGFEGVSPEDVWTQDFTKEATSLLKEIDKDFVESGLPKSDIKMMRDRIAGLSSTPLPIDLRVRYQSILEKHARTMNEEHIAYGSEYPGAGGDWGSDMISEFVASYAKPPAPSVLRKKKFIGEKKKLGRMPRPEKPRAPVEMASGPSVFLSPAMRSVHERLDRKAQETLAKPSRAGAVTLPGGKPATGKPTGGEAQVEEMLERGRGIATGAVARIQDVVERQAEAIKENFLHFKYNLRKNPQFRDNIRTQFIPMRRRHIDKVMTWRVGIFGDLFSAEGKAGVQKATDLVILRDLRQRGQEGQTLPGDLSVEQVEKHLAWLEENSSDGVKQGAQDLQGLFNALGQELVARGKIPQARENYSPHVVLEYQPEWMTGLRFPMKHKFRQPYRGYTKRAVGSNKLIATDDASLWTHVAKVELDNAQEDWMLQQAHKYDKTREWIKELKAQGKKPHPLRKGDPVMVGGKPYTALEWKKTSFKKTAIEEGLLKEALANNMLVSEWLESRGPRGGKPVREVIAKGRPVMFLVPSDVANTMDNLIERSDPLWDVLYAAGKGTQLWKRFTLTAAGAPYQLGNLIGDTINTAVFDPGAFPYMDRAFRVNTKLFYPQSRAGKAINLTPFEQKVLRVAEEKDVAHSGMISELRRVTETGKIARAYETASEFREAQNRLAILAHQLDRAGRGLPVQRVAGINIKGLDPESAAAKVAREALVDYVATPRLYQLLLSRGIAPFVRFHEANLRNHLRAAATPETAIKYIMPVATAYAAAWAWNNLNPDRKEEEMALPDYIRNRFHINLGKTKEGDIWVWAPQQPVDMAASWLGMDNVGRIVGDIHAGRITAAKGARELVTAMGNGWRENSSSLMNPVIQALKGLNTNEDPFTRRKVMPDAVHKRWKEDITDLNGIRYAIPYLAEKIVTPVAQYTRTKRGDEPVKHPILDWIKTGPLNVVRGLGFYEFDPAKQDLSRHFDATTNADMAYEVWRDKYYRMLERGGVDPVRNVEFIRDARDAGLTDMAERVKGWSETPKAQIKIINYKLRQTDDASLRRRLKVQRAKLYKQMTAETLPSKPARGLYEKETGKKLPPSKEESSQVDIAGEVRRSMNLPVKPRARR